jgi:phytoene dehydrogenase-like protein
VLFAGNAAHSMLPLERRPSAGVALALLTMGHTVGWPFPRGGASGLTDALVARLRSLGGEVRTSSPVDELPPADLVLADAAPRALVRIARGRLSARFERELLRYRHGPGAFKLDWALSAPIPWRAPEAARAGTVHLGGTLDELARPEREPWAGRTAERPFVLLAQQGRFDPSRGQTAWAYCHVPNGSAEDMTERIEAQVERFAPGFRDVVLARHAMGPEAFEEHNRNLVGGDLNKRDGSRPALLSARAAARSLSDADSRRLPLLGGDAAGRRRARALRSCRGAPSPARPAAAVPGLTSRASRGTRIPARAAARAHCS